MTESGVRREEQHGRRHTRRDLLCQILLSGQARLTDTYARVRTRSLGFLRGAAPVWGAASV
jgi:hypothetical protein